MATKRKYAYYLKGNNIAIIEENIGSGVCSLSGYSNQTTCENAGGTWTENAFSSEDSQYKSPVASINSGLEIQYAYSPTFNLQATGQEGADFHSFLGWGSDGTYLLLFTFMYTTVADLSSLFAADDWIYISGSGRWSGLHQVKSTGGTTGVLQLKTKCNLKPSSVAIQVTWTDTEIFDGSDAATDDLEIEVFKAAQAYRDTPYVFIKGATHISNNGFFSLSPNTNTGQLSFANKIRLHDNTGAYSSTAAEITTKGSADTIVMYNAFYEQISVYEGVEVMSGESAETFELDVSRYQANAVVYYVKAKIAEDAGDFEKREFFMREFKRQLEKGAGALKRGPYIVQGFKEMR